MKRFFVASIALVLVGASAGVALDRGLRARRDAQQAAQADAAREERLDKLSQKVDSLIGAVPVLQANLAGQNQALAESLRAEFRGARAATSGSSAPLPVPAPAASASNDLAQHPEWQATVTEVDDLMNRVIDSGQLGPDQMDEMRPLLHSLPGETRLALLRKLFVQINDGKVHVTGHFSL
jgi:hypothetical protein